MQRAPFDPDHGHHDSRTPPEAALVYAILSRAIQDLFSGVGGTLMATQIPLIRRDAMAFLTNKTGKWADQRVRFCSLVGLDADILRSRIIAILEGDDRPLAAYYGGKDHAHVEEARALWRAGAPTPPRPVKRAVSATTEDDQNRIERRKTVLRMLKHGPTTIQELSAATGRAITGRQVAGFLYHAEKEGLVQRDGDLWSLVPQARVQYPIPPVAANRS